MNTRAIEFVAQVLNGRLPREIERQIDGCIGRCNGKWVKVSLEERKRRRSPNQNAYYWGVVVQHVLDMFLAAGNQVDADQVHDYLRAHVGKLTAPVVDPNGEMRNVLRSSTSLNTMEFEAYLEAIRAWAAGFGFQIPLPNENFTYEGAAS